MPRPPALSPTVAALRGSVYSALAHRLAQHQGEVYPLHVGDTWMEPEPGSRAEDLTVDRFPGMHRYAEVQGRRRLLDALVDRARATGVPTERADVLVTAGATGGLCAALGALLAPGDEVIVIAPYWPLVEGMITLVGGRTVAVSFLDVDSAEAAVEAVQAAVTERTVALYVNTPNNPTGRVYPATWLAALAEVARRHDLWLIADEVYELTVFEGTHVPLRPFAPERTISAHSFSKCFGMAGNRCGWLVGPEAVLAGARRVATHTYYTAPTVAQIAAEEALLGPGFAWAARARERYATVGRQAAARLGVPAPQGSTFLFLDLAHALDDTGVAGFLERCVERGLFIAPGSSFGPFPTHARMCFTAAPADVVLRGVEVLAELLRR